MQALAKTDDDKPSKPLRVTGKLRTACDYLVHEGLHFDEAARKANLSVRAMRYALSRAHVVAYLRQQREVLREAMCGANLWALADVRDQTDNQNARVAAVNALERMGEPDSPMGSRRSGTVTMPGLVIQIIQSEAMGHAIDVEATNNATISTGSVPLVGERRSGEESE